MSAEQSLPVLISGAGPTGLTLALAFYGQSFPLFIGEPKPLSLELIFQNTVFFDEIVDDCLLVAIKPAGQSD